MPTQTVRVYRREVEAMTGEVLEEPSLLHAYI
jgi:hypothetical protein